MIFGIDQGSGKTRMLQGPFVPQDEPFVPLGKLKPLGDQTLNVRAKRSRLLKTGAACCATTRESLFRGQPQKGSRCEVRQSAAPDSNLPRGAVPRRFWRRPRR